jgi:hypothetical protein
MEIHPFFTTHGWDPRVCDEVLCELPAAEATIHLDIGSMFLLDTGHLDIGSMFLLDTGCVCFLAAAS